MTLKADLSAITPTTTARQAFKNAGTDLDQMIAEANTHAADLQALLRQIIAFHPSSSGDSSNHAALVSLLGELT
jgi:hypothetical protein